MPPEATRVNVTVARIDKDGNVTEVLDLGNIQSVADPTDKPYQA